MSSEDLRKHIRTQGKYSDTDLMKGRDKRPKVSPKDKSEKKVSKRYSDERRKSDEQSSSVKYQENSTGYAYNQLDDHPKAVEISKRGKHVISNTERGESLIYYNPDLFEEEEAWELFHYFESTTTWNTKNIVIRGIEYPQPRLVAWYGPYPYTYSGTTLEAAEMPEGVIIVKQKIEAYLKEQGVDAEFNSVLLNMYRDEKDSVAWHSDDELTMGICPTIASISLGEVRRFELRPKKRYDEENQLESPEMYMNLCHGSLVVMDGCMQEDWQHRIPKEYHDKGTRINLTFRTVFPIDKLPCLPEKECPKQYAVATNSSKTTNSGREVQFKEADFPSLDSTVKTNGKHNVSSELSGSDIACDNKTYDKNWGESTCEDTKSDDKNWGESTCEDTKSDDKNWGESTWEDTKSEDESIDTSGALMSSPDDTTEMERTVVRERDGFLGRGKREGVTFGRSHEDERMSLNDTTARPSSGFVPRRDVRVRAAFSGRGKRENVTVGKSRLDYAEPPRYRQSDREKGRFSRNQNPVERGPPRNFNYNDRINRQPGREREERQNCNTRPMLDPREGRCREDEIEPRSGRFERLRDGNEERSPRSRPSDNVMRQNNSVRQGYSSYVPRERNSQTRDDNYYAQRVPQTQYVNKRHEIRKCNDLPPRYSNKRNPPVYRVEDGNLSEESFDNNKHASDMVRKEHHRPNHNEARSNSTLNVAASEFVPKCRMPDCNYNRMSLKDLVDQNIKQMKDYDLQLHAESLKNRLLEIRDEFEPDEKEELDFLCDLTDGSQSEKNQRLISSKMARIVLGYTNRNGEIRCSF